MQSNDKNEAEKQSGASDGEVDRRSYLKLVGGTAVAGVTGAGVPTVRGADGLHRTLTIEATGTKQSYEFTAEGNLNKSTAFGGSIGSEDTVSESTASGTVAGSGRDSYSFSGEITSWSGDYDALNLYLNGEELNNLIALKGPPGERVTYRLRVDGEVLKSTDFNGTIQDSDKISGRTKDYGLDTSIRNEDDLNGETIVEGELNGGTDSYLYSGDVTDLRADVLLEVYINGDIVRYSDLERDIITIDGCGCETAREYTFTVETGVAKTDAYNGSINSSDTIDGSEVSGSVVGGRDSYAYTGEIQSIDVPSSIQVLKNGTEVNPGSLLDEKKLAANKLPHKITISIDTEERQEYGFSVTGDLAVGELGNSSSGDRAANGYGRGYGAFTGADEYRFSGKLESISDFTCIQLDIDRQNKELILRDLTNSSNPPYGYEITVSGSLSKVDSNNNATVNGGTVSGKVAGKKDVFEFTGGLLEVIFPTSIKVMFETDIRKSVGYKTYQLRGQHGSYNYKMKMNECTERIERGDFVFADGTKIPVITEFVEEDKIRYTIDGEEFKLGGGWP